MFDSEYDEEIRKQAVMSVRELVCLLPALMHQLSLSHRRYFLTLKCECTGLRGGACTDEIGGENGKKQKHLSAKVGGGIPLL